MTYTATLKFAPILSVERLNNTTWERPGRTLYWSRSLKLLPGRTEIPLLIDHDMSRQVASWTCCSR
jgi:hypothetical protein